MSGSLHAFTPYDIELKVLFILFLCFFFFFFFFGVAATYCVLNMQQFSSLPLCICLFFPYVREKSRFLILKLVFLLHENLNYHGIIGSSLSSIEEFWKIEQILLIKWEKFRSAAATGASAAV